MFRGLQTGRVDDKFRLKFSALIRKSLKETYGDMAVFITSLEGDDVKVFPLQEWQKVENSLSQKSVDGNDLDGTVKSKLLFQANRFGAEDSLDGQGRILIPAPLREGAGMGGEVMIQWMGNHMLVLNAERYREMTVEQSLNEEEKAYARNLGL